MFIIGCVIFLIYIYFYFRIVLRQNFFKKKKMIPKSLAFPVP